MGKSDINIWKIVPDYLHSSDCKVNKTDAD